MDNRTSTVDEEDGILALSSTPAMVLLSSNSSSYVYNKDDLKFQDPANPKGWLDVEFESLLNDNGMKIQS